MKRLLAALLFASIALCITGCAGGSKTEAGQTVSASPEESGEYSAEDSDGASIEPSALAGRTPEHTFERTYGLLGDKEDVTKFDVCAGDVISVEVENTTGSLDLAIQVDDETLYDQKEVKEESCVLEVDADGTCTVTVSGNPASGHFTVDHYAGTEDA